MFTVHPLYENIFIFQQFDTAKTLDSSHLPIALPSDGGLPWYSLSNYDILMTFAATPRILFTKLLGRPIILGSLKI